MKDEDKKAILEALGITFAHYGEERSVDATPEEAQMFSVIQEMFEAEGFDPSQLELVRKSKDYVSASVGDLDVVRMKFTERAKWIIYPYAEEKAVKHYIETPDDIRSMTELFTAQVTALAKYTELKSID